MHYEGSFEVAAPKEKVYAFVTDPAQVTSIFPDAQDLRVVGADTFSLKVKVGVSFIRGVMDVKMTFVERRPPAYAKMHAKGSGMSSTVDLENAFTLEDRPGGGTVVRWTADAKVGGLMANVGSRMMDTVSAKYVKEIIGALNAKLS